MEKRTQGARLQVAGNEPVMEGTDMRALVLTLAAGQSVPRHYHSEITDHFFLKSRANGRERQKVMTLAGDEFIRRFLIHVLPNGFHRIRHYRLFANGGRAETLARARGLLCVSPAQSEPGDADTGEPPPLLHPCPCCGGRIIIIETFARGSTPRTRPSSPLRIDTS